MHVKDKRVFNFSDSVMLSLQRCSRFALEVQPDSAMAKMFAMLQNTDTLRSISKLLDKQQYEKLAKKFEEKNGYPMGKTHPLLVQSLMDPDLHKPGDKVSFIDAYLYGIARTLNKGIYGLEDASSQFDQYYGSSEEIKATLLDLIDEDSETYTGKGKERMIDIYRTGDLDAIYRYAFAAGMLDTVIAARNEVMVASMIKYMAGDALFTAVGAAHLPGPDGVISLLRKAGYNVDLVPATFTGVANRYHIDYMKMNWPVYRDDAMGYSVAMPGVPIKTKVLSGYPTITYADLANGVYYGIYAVQQGTAEAPAKRLEVIKSALDRIQRIKTNKIISKKEFLLNNMPCTEVTVKSGSGYTRSRLVVANNILYCFYVGSDLNHLNEPYDNRYLNSFKTFAVTMKPPAAWITYTDTTGAFSIKFPQKPNRVTQQVPSPGADTSVRFKLNLYVSTDSANLRTMLCGITITRPAIFSRIRKLY